MVLTVDKTDEEKHLSIICDIAKMLNISDDEMKDISDVIQFIYGKHNLNYKFKSKKAEKTFSCLIDMFK